MSAKRRTQTQKEPQKTGLTLNKIEPLTNAQERVFEEYDNDQHLFLHGSAGTGKTLIALYLALEDVLNKRSKARKVIIIRSATSSKDIGFLPGNEKEKLEVFEAPYKGICNTLFGRGDAYSILKTNGIIEFHSSSFLRGITIDNSIVIIDEFQDLCWNELAVSCSRPSDTTKMIYCGDVKQSDLKFDRDRTGFLTFFKIIKKIKEISSIEFGLQDVVRGGFCKSWLLACDEYERENNTSLLNL